MAAAVLNDFALKRETYVAAQYLANRKRFVRAQFSRMHEATIDEAALAEFKQEWAQQAIRLQMIPGKEALSDLNSKLQERYGVNVTPTAIVEGMAVGDMFDDMRQLVRGIAEFAALKPE